MGKERARKLMAQHGNSPSRSWLSPHRGWPFADRRDELYWPGPHLTAIRGACEGRKGRGRGTVDGVQDLRRFICLEAN